MSAPFSPVARSVASSRREPRRRIDSEGSEAFLAELESELHADVSSDQVAPISTLPTRNASTGRHSSAISEISEADSDALADLERELEQSVDEAPPRALEEAALANPTSPARRKRGRSAPLRVLSLEQQLVLFKHPNRNQLPSLVSNMLAL